MSDFDEIIPELQEVADTASLFKPKPLKNPNHKWLVRSALQKAIRRNRPEEALRAGAYLMGTDPTYAWYGLSICIIEDIGFGDPDLLAYSTITNLKTVTTKIDSPAKLFAGMIVRACETQKTRACCEVSLGAEMASPELKLLTAKQPDEMLLDELFGNTVLAAQYFAACELRRRCSLDGKALMKQVLTRIMETVPDFAMARASMLTFERFSDTMNLATFPLVRRLYGEVGNVKQLDYSLVTDYFPPEIEILGFSSAAQDMHVMTGKRAIKAFYTSLAKNHPVMAELGKQADDVVKALGSLIFILEGGQETDRMWNDQFDAMKTYQDTNFARGYGVPPELYEELKKLVSQNWDVLNDKRVWSVQQ